MSNPSEETSTLPISPSVIVGIVIVLAFAVVIVGASLFRFCKRNGRSTPFDDNSNAQQNEGNIFNPNAQRSAAQIARMKEVRWINNMYAWERGREAMLESGELRPTTMIAGRKGEARNWDEWSTMQDENGESLLHQTGEPSSSGPSHLLAQTHSHSHFYAADDPYAASSQQRLSHVPSILLPQPLTHRDLQLPLHPHSSPGGSPLRYHQVAASDHPDHADSNPNSNSNSSSKSNSNSIKTDDHNMEEITLIDDNHFGRDETATTTTTPPTITNYSYRSRIGGLNNKSSTPDIVLTSPRF
ncbi:hypothetical protein PV10_02665 [Exophiala mesophila]|uniref:Uncharacterized protein n=1 Tax=Exophiala mesophila TaxID=212818 RepID=A0A0D1Y2Z2_EXOME|nr:uncharacterized protein PV10_02665 [Exophiala mesophila]KIV94951.1 hypothetical protein PV10_02665 [Exophiala mesophila]